MRLQVILYRMQEVGTGLDHNMSAPPTAIRPAALASVPTPPPPFSMIAAFEPSARAPAAAALRMLDAS